MEVSGLESGDGTVVDSALEKNGNNNTVDGDGLAENDTAERKESEDGAGEGNVASLKFRDLSAWTGT